MLILIVMLFDDGILVRFVGFQRIVLILLVVLRMRIVGQGPIVSHTPNNKEK